MSATVYDRETLVDLCTRGVVPESAWHDRDSSDAQRQLGEARALLAAGCKFHIVNGTNLKTDDRTIWVEIEFKGFAHFDHDGHTEDETYYIPTAQRLEQAAGRDWY